MTRSFLPGLLAGVGLSTLGLVAPGPAALAADLPLRTSIPTYEPPPPPVFSWSGPYVGLVVGTAADGDFFGHVETRFAQAEARTSAGGFTVGGTLGYNYQFTPGSGFVLGVEIDGGYSDFRSNASLRGNTAFGLPGFGFATGAGLAADSFSVSVRGRAGYAFGPMLAYATGGFAATEIGYGASVAVTGFDVPGLPRIPGIGSIGRFPGYAVSSARSTMIDGYVVGGGVEYAATQAISLKAEYLYAEYDRSKNLGFAGTPVRVGGGLETHQLRVGANYRFAGFPGFGI